MILAGDMRLCVSPAVFAASPIFPGFDAGDDSGDTHKCMSPAESRAQPDRWARLLRSSTPHPTSLREAALSPKGKEGAEIREFPDFLTRISRRLNGFRKLECLVPGPTGWGTTWNAFAFARWGKSSTR